LTYTRATAVKRMDTELDIVLPSLEPSLLSLSAVRITPTASCAAAITPNTTVITVFPMVTAYILRPC